MATGKQTLMAWLLLAAVVTGSPLILSTGTLAQDEEPGAHRALPQSAECGTTITISIQVDPPEGTDSWIVVENLPDIVTFESLAATHNGDYNEDHHRIDWVSMNGTGAELTYEVTIKDTLPDGTEILFEGEHRFHPVMDDRDKTTGAHTVIADCAAAGPTGTVTRVLPETADCGTMIQVRLLVEPGTAQAFVIEESSPEQTTVEDWTTRFEGHHADENGQLKWFSLNAEPTVLTYNLSVNKDLDRKSTLGFDGQYGFMPSDGDIQEIDGDDQLPVTCGSLTPLLLGGGIAMAAVGAGFFVMRRSSRSDTPEE